MKSCLSILFSFFIGLLSFAQLNVFQSELKKGSFSVSFRKRYVNDYSHSYSPNQKAGEPHYRPLAVNIWYPTESVLINKKVSIQSTFSYHNKKDTRNDIFFNALKKHYKEYILNNLLPLKDSSAIRAQIGLNNFSFIAFEDLPPIADKKFPVILYLPDANGGPFENSVLGEFLASHGFVFITAAFLPSDLKDLNQSTSVNLMLSDVAAMLPALVKELYIDWSKLGLFANGFGTQVGMQQLNEAGCNYKSAFLLFPKEKLSDSWNIPSFVVSPELIPSTRKITSVKMNRFDAPVTSFALLKNYFGRKTGNEEWKNDLKNYHYLCDFALLFFKATLMKDENSIKAIEQRNAKLSDSVFSWQAEKGTE